MLTVAIDAFPLTGNITGIGRYTLELCRRLDGLLPEIRFALLSPLPLSIGVPSGRWKVCLGGAWLSRIASSYVWLKIYGKRLAEAEGAKVFWATRTILPCRSPRFRTISTVHDLNIQLFPQSMPYASMVAHRIWFKRDLRRADKVVTNSRGTARRLRKLLGIREDAVVRPGVCPPFVRQSREHVRKKLTSLGIHQPYFLAVATLEPRKNLASLIKAFVSLKNQDRLPRHVLYVVGSPGWKEKKLRAVLRDAENMSIKWLGVVSDDNLAALYAGAEACIVPSLYEGFGMPALEARACGVQVVATDIEELREAAGTKAIYVQPDIDGIRQGLLRAIGSAQAEESQVEEYNWDEPSRIMADILTDMLRS